MPGSEKTLQPFEVRPRQLQQVDFESDRAGLVSALHANFERCSAIFYRWNPIELKRNLIESTVSDSLMIHT
jgi:hypothetical protein